MAPVHLALIPLCTEDMVVTVATEATEATVVMAAMVDTGKT